MALGACAGQAGAGPASAATTAAPAPSAEQRPLEGLARGGGLVFPVQRLELAAGVAAPAGGSADALRDLDRELAFALDERGLGATVSGAAAAERLARLNRSYAGDPHALPLSATRQLKAGDEVEEPLASRLRSVAALADRRHVVVPLALRVEPVSSAPSAEAGAVRAALQLALVDVRLARVLWAGATAPVEATYPSGALAPRVASRFADLFVAPPEP